MLISYTPVQNKEFKATKKKKIRAIMIMNLLWTKMRVCVPHLSCQFLWLQVSYPSSSRLKGRLSIHALEPTLSWLLRTPFWLSCCFSDCSSLSSLQDHLHLFLWPEFPTILSPSSVFTFLSSLCITTLCRWPICLNLQPRPSLWALYPVPDYCLSVSLWICQKHLRFNVFKSELIPSSLDLDLF